MTKKHYVAIAKILKDHKPTDQFQIDNWWRMVKDMADFFEHDNPNFDADKFIQAIMEQPK
jgi:hypothetical protein